LLTSVGNIAKEMVDSFKDIDMDKTLAGLRSAIVAQQSRMMAIVDIQSHMDINRTRGNERSSSNITNYNQNLTFVGNGPVKPSEASREMRDAVRRMEWSK